jgi:hypothetical protein
MLQAVLPPNCNRKSWRTDHNWNIGKNTQEQIGIVPTSLPIRRRVNLT